MNKAYWVVKATTWLSWVDELLEELPPQLLIFNAILGFWLAHSNNWRTTNNNEPALNHQGSIPSGFDHLWYLYVYKTRTNIIISYKIWMHRLDTLLFCWYFNIFKMTLYYFWYHWVSSWTIAVTMSRLPWYHSLAYPDFANDYVFKFKEPCEFHRANGQYF